MGKKENDKAMAEAKAEAKRHRSAMHAAHQKGDRVAQAAHKEAYYAANRRWVELWRAAKA